MDYSEPASALAEVLLRGGFLRFEVREYCQNREPAELSLRSGLRSQSTLLEKNVGIGGTRVQFIHSTIQLGIVRHQNLQVQGSGPRFTRNPHLLPVF